MKLKKVFAVPALLLATFSLQGSIIKNTSGYTLTVSFTVKGGVNIHQSLHPGECLGSVGKAITITGIYVDGAGTGRFSPFKVGAHDMACVGPKGPYICNYLSQRNCPRGDRYCKKHGTCWKDKIFPYSCCKEHAYHYRVHWYKK